MGREGRALVAELFRFHVVGAGTVLIGTLVFLGLVALGVPYAFALAGDYAAGILFSYYMNKTYTFRAQVSSDARPLALTIMGYIAAFLLNLVLLALAVEMFALNVILSQVVIMLVLAALNFVLFKFVVFGGRSVRPGPAQGRDT